MGDEEEQGRIQEMVDGIEELQPLHAVAQEMDESQMRDPIVQWIQRRNQAWNALARSGIHPRVQLYLWLNLVNDLLTDEKADPALVHGVVEIWKAGLDARISVSYDGSTDPLQEVYDDLVDTDRRSKQ